MPVPDNAIYHLAGALQRLSQFGFPLKTNEVTRAYFEQLGKTQNGLLPIAQGSETAMRQAAAISPGYNATLRTTCVATELEGGHARNALPQLAAATVNCRVLPEDSVEYVQSTLEKVFADNQVKVTLLETPTRGPASPLNPQLMHTIGRVTDTLWPNVPVVPTMVMGATDGRFLRAAGIPTYGVQGFFMNMNDFRAHGRDERIPVKSFYEGQTFLYQLVKALSSTAQ